MGDAQGRDRSRDRDERALQGGRPCGADGGHVVLERRDEGTEVFAAGLALQVKCDCREAGRILVGSYHPVLALRVEAVYPRVLTQLNRIDAPEQALKEAQPLAFVA